MVQLGTLVKVTDKTGISIAACIKVLGSGKKSIALVGDVVLISVKYINLLRFSRMKDKQKQKYSCGTIHRALIIRTKSNIMRFPGVFYKFDENSVVIVNKDVVPISNRIYGPVIRDLCMRHPSVGCVSRFLV